MSVTVVFEPKMPSLGPAVAAIGVFDGVHRGHQALLAAAVRDAERRGVRSVAVTFDRDPDQVIDPDSAAPQLLTLEDKLGFIAQMGIEAVLVVPFTPQIAALEPTAFLDTVLAVAIQPVALHVGRDFRFGARAAGDVEALDRWAMARGADVAPQRLLEIDGVPVTSTRIRTLIAEGCVAEAAALLGRPTRVSGTVVRGRGAGREFGVPTANIEPVPFAALPADGVYAGLAEVPAGVFAAAISVGTPPMFPEAKDYLEAHLIDFDGDLYDDLVTLQFVDRLRSLVRYDSVDDLLSAIRRDVREAARVIEQLDEPVSPLDMGFLSDGTPVVDDPDALLAAEQAVRDDNPLDSAWEAAAESSWVPVMTEHYSVGSARLGRDQNLMRAWSLLHDAGLPTGWDPYPPGSEHSHFFWVIPRPVSLLVPEEYAEQAEQLLSEADDLVVGEDD